MATTVKSGLFVPEVATEIASAEFPNKLALGFAGSPFVQVLDPVMYLGEAGDAVKFPRWDAISAFGDLTEDTAMVPVALTSTYDTATVVAGGVAIEITDTAHLAAHGDPSVEIGRQIAARAARYVDAKLIATALTTTASGTVAASSGTFTVDLFNASLVSAWGDKAFDNIGGLVVHSKVLGDIVSLADFKSAASNGEVGSARYGLQAVGTISGYPLFVSDSITSNAGGTTTYNNLVLKRGALGVMFQRELLVEADRNILKKNTIVAGDVRFAVHQFYANPSLVMKLVTR